MIRRFFSEHFDIALWAKVVTGKLVEQGIVEADDREIYEYGFDVLIYTLISLGAILLLGALLSRFWVTFFFLIAPIPLQGLGGGYHADTHLKCFVTLVCAYLAGMALCALLSPVISLLLGALGFASIYAFAPVEHVNAPMSAEKAGRMKRFARLYGGTVFIAATTLTVLAIPYGAALAVGVFTSGVSMFAAKKMKTKG